MAATSATWPIDASDFDAIGDVFVQPRFRIKANGPCGSRHFRVYCIPSAMFEVGHFVTGYEIDDAGP
jgi:hypothetical protein